MKKSIMKKWVKALRSGEYEQGIAEMVEEMSSGEHAFCCLGVLTNLYVEENGLKGFTFNERENWLKFNGENDNQDGLLTNAVQKWAGLKTNIGEYGNKMSDTLVHLNDNGKSFKQIANIIEKKWEVL